MKMGLLLFIVVVFLLFYAFLTSSSKTNFEDLASLMTMLGLMICSQIAMYAIINPNTFLTDKNMHLGWAQASNSTAMILLLCVPFVYYNAMKNKGFKALMLYALTVIELLGIIVTYSRGAIFSALVAYFIFVIVLICMKETRKKCFFSKSLCQSADFMLQ